MRVGILTGGGDCPGLNPAIRGIVMRGLDHGFEMHGIQLGWKGLVEGMVEPIGLDVARPRAGGIEIARGAGRERRHGLLVDAMEKRRPVGRTARALLRRALRVEAGLLQEDAGKEEVV